MKKRFTKIVPHPVLRDRRTERRIIESNRETIIYGMMAAGGVLIFVALIW